MIPLFVYGVHRTGGGSEQLLGARRRRVGTAPGALWILPGGQVVLVAEAASRVVGELVDDVDDRMLALLDHLEGVRDGVVRRARVEVRVGLRIEPAWTWVAEVSRARTGRRYGASRWIPVQVR
jgi:gamma-glutamylcyclotransferase (GGCT)/AIG2-like uncharacterized protein YtfP